MKSLLRDRAEKSQSDISCRFLTQKELDPDFIDFNSVNRRYHYPARFYLAYRGAFGQVDPLIRDLKARRAVLEVHYGFVRSNPTQLVDPLGLKLTISGTPGYQAQALAELNNFCPDGKWKMTGDAVEPGVAGFCKKTLKLRISWRACLEPLYVFGASRPCDKTSTPLACCCICDAIDEWGTIDIRNVHGEFFVDDKVFQTKFSVASPDSGVLTNFGGGQKVKVSAIKADGSTVTEEQPSPDWLSLGHEICTHGMHHFWIDSAVIDFENKLRAERAKPLPPRTGEDHK